MRKSGILLPITSLASPHGIGCFSQEAYEFVDFLAAAGQACWQILPLGPTGFGDSPYQSFSTFAGNPYFIDLDDLVGRGWLTAAEIKKYDVGTDGNDHVIAAASAERKLESQSNTGSIDYEKIHRSRFKLLHTAFENAAPKRSGRYRAFVAENAYWLDDYALFMALKDAHGGAAYSEWAVPLKLREEKALEKCRKQYRHETDFYRFQQYLFHEQWMRLKQYANKKGIKIIGDIPIYVSLDSSDAWASPELFQFDEDLRPTFVAGCPPDYFSADGQLWGNPLYRWEHHKETGYEWWIKRIAHCFLLYDVVRIDHFRGFEAYYSIPYGEKTARRGKWQKGPGYDIFRCLKQALGEKEIIAEDLGFLTPAVLRLVKRTGYPGMKILQFAFDSREDSDYLPHNYIKNSVVYTGTHDNDTIVGWYKDLVKIDRDFCDEYLNLHKVKRSERHLEFIRHALASVSDLAVIPMADYLGLGSKARINIPSTVGENWKWRLEKDALSAELAARIRALCELYRRCP